jgi:ABC-type phosphate transport system ATPase subunit
MVQGNPERVVGLYGEGSGTGRLTKLDDAIPGSCWRPVLSGTTAQQALQAVDAIAESIKWLPGERGPSLAGGQAGLALLYAWLARTRRAPQADVLAWQCLDQAIEAAATQAMNASLWGGFTGVAWAADLVGCLLDPDAEDRSEAVDGALMRLLSRADPWSAPYDLVVGLTGLGVYALQRYPRPLAIEYLRRVVERMHGCARQDEHGLYWWTPPAEIHPESRERINAEEEVREGRLELRSLRRQIGIVTQRPYLFGATIRQNIALTNPAMPLEMVVDAAKLACIHDEIAAMPMGYETRLVDGGASLSGGQQQRIAIARALAHRPTILLLDEATSDLDSVTERMVQHNISTLGCTRIVIAHRLSTIVNADLILVMEKGRIAQRGTHDELMALPGAYSEQVMAQHGSASPDTSWSG